MSRDAGTSNSDASVDAAPAPTRWRVSDLILDTRRQRVWRGSQEIPLPKLSYDLFVELVRRFPELASNEELMKAVWPGIIVSPETVSQRVKLLRAALGDESRTPRYVGMLRARGYHLVPPVEAMSNEAAQQEPVRAPTSLPVSANSESALSLLDSELEPMRRERPDWAITQVRPPENAATSPTTVRANSGAVSRHWRLMVLIGATALIIGGLLVFFFRH